jgi:hypothetical protein
MTKSGETGKPTQHTLMVCHGPACRRRGADALATALEGQLPSDINLARGGCFGRCPVGINAILRAGPEPTREFDRRKVRDDDVLLSSLAGGDDTLRLLPEAQRGGARVLIGDDVRPIRR